MKPFFFLPIWFFPYGLILELLFIAGSLGFSISAWRIYTLTGVRRMKLLSISFLLFAFSYAIIALANAAQLTLSHAGMITGAQKATIILYALYGFVVLQSAAITTLLYMTLRRDDTLLLISLFSLTGVILSTMNLMYFALYAIIVLSIVSATIISRYLQKPRTLHLIYGSFIVLLAIDKLSFLLDLETQGSFISHIILTVAYTIMISLLIFIHYGKKK